MQKHQQFSNELSFRPENRDDFRRKNHSMNTRLTTYSEEPKDSYNMFPFIKQRPLKLNQIRNENGQFQQNLSTLQSRVNALRKEKEHNNKQLIWAREKITALQKVRERCEEDERKRKQYQQRKQLESIYLKKRAEEIKLAHRNFKDTFDLMKAQRKQELDQLKKERKKDELLHIASREQLIQSNKRRAQQIKSMQKQISEQLKLIEVDKKHQARSYRLQKYHKQMQRKQDTARKLHELSNEEEALIQELKISETIKMEEFRTLKNLINPETPSAMTDRNSRSVYTGLYKKVVKELDKRDFSVS